MMATVGRPAQFRNAAEKQKAYRQRKKRAILEAEALRKAEWAASEEGLKAKHDALHSQCDAWLHNSPHHTNGYIVGEDNYNQWVVRYRQLCDEWWEARKTWWDKHIENEKETKK